MKIGKSKIIGDVAQGFGGAGGNAYHKVAVGNPTERAGNADIVDSSGNLLEPAITKPATDGMIRYNTQNQHLEAFIRGEWTNIISDADIAIPGINLTGDNITLQYLALILRQISRNVSGSIITGNGGIATSMAVSSDQITYLSNITGGVTQTGTSVPAPTIRGASVTYGINYAILSLPTPLSTIAYSVTVDAFTAANLGASSEQRWNYRYTAFASIYNVDTVYTGQGDDAAYYNGSVFITPAWTTEPSSDPLHTDDKINNPDYGKFILTVSTANASVGNKTLPNSFGVRWFVSLFKYQNYSLTNVSYAPALPTITKLTAHQLVTINLSQITLSFNAYSYIKGLYGVGWDSTTTPLTVHINIDSGINFTGTITSGSNIITAVSSTNSITIGSVLKSSNINFPSGATVTNFTTNTITISTNATSSASNVSITVAVIIGSTSPTIPAFAVGGDLTTGWPSGTTISLVNKGYIIGCGGNGGDGYGFIRDRITGYVVSGISGPTTDTRITIDTPYWTYGANNATVSGQIPMLQTTANYITYAAEAGSLINASPNMAQDGGVALDASGFQISIDNTNGYIFGAGGGGAGGEIHYIDTYRFYATIASTPTLFTIASATSSFNSNTPAFYAVNKSAYFGLYNDTNNRIALVFVMQNTDNYSFTGSITSGSKVITGVNSTTGLSVGMSLNSVGSGFPVGATISSTSSNTVTMSIAATGTTSGISVAASSTFTLNVGGLPNNANIGFDDGFVTPTIVGHAINVTYTFPGSNSGLYYFSIGNLQVSDLDGVAISGTGIGISHWNFMDEKAVVYSENISTINTITINYSKAYVGGAGGGGGLGWPLGVGGNGGLTGNIPLDPVNAPGQVKPDTLGNDGDNGNQGGLNGNLNFNDFSVGGKHGGTNILTQGGDGGGIGTDGSQNGAGSSIYNGKAGNAVVGNTKITWLNGNKGGIIGNIS